MRDTTQDAGTMGAYLAAALAELRLEQGRLAQARVAVGQLPDERRGQRATAAMLRARLRRTEANSSGASAFLEQELATLWE